MIQSAHELPYYYSTVHTENIYMETCFVFSVYNIGTFIFEFDKNTPLN